MVENHKYFEFADEGFEDGYGARFVVDGTSLSAFQKANASEIADHLAKMYSEAKEGSLIELTEVMEDLIELRAAWVRMKDGA